MLFNCGAKLGMFLKMWVFLGIFFLVGVVGPPMIVHFFAQKLVKEANTVWDQNGWTSADSDQLSKGHLHTP